MSKAANPQATLAVPSPKGGDGKSPTNRLAKYRSQPRVGGKQQHSRSDVPFFFPDVPVEKFSAYLQAQVVRLGGDMFDHLDVEMEVLQQMTQVNMSSSRIHRIKHGRAASKNRYNTVLPFSHCRVRLSHNDAAPSSSLDNHNQPELGGNTGGLFNTVYTPHTGQFTPLSGANITAVSLTGEVDMDDDGDNDYINASHVNLLSEHDREHSRDYVATSAPLPSTVTDYWRMVWEQKVELVVMITKLVELGRVKAHEYWPVNVGDVNTLDNGMQITLVKTEAKLLADCKLDPEQIAVRTFEVVNTKAKSKTPQVVVHVHYMAWPDHGVPSLDNFLDLFKVYRHLRVNLPWDVGNPHTPARDEGQDASSSSSSFMLSCDCPRAPPIVVHCSAGIGRTGTFIAIDSILDLLRDGHRKVINIFDIVKQLRQCRPGMVQTKSQYAFIYDVVERCVNDKECPVYVDAFANTARSTEPE